MRHSHVAYVIIRLPTIAGTSLLLRKHEKWGDWSLVGGHVEDWEIDDWSRAALREASEELEPLVAEQDFCVSPIHNEPFTWGPERSRSAHGERTLYHIQYFNLAFLRDPIELLSRLPAAEFILVPESAIDSEGNALGRPVHRARRFLAGIEAVAPAWGKALDIQCIPTGMRRTTQDKGATRK